MIKGLKLNSNIIPYVSLDTGELINSKHRYQDNKYMVRGHKMYGRGMEHLIDTLTREEMKFTVRIYNIHSISYENILIGTFKSHTENMTTVKRSKLKHKLLTNSIIGEYNKKLMLNPFIFVPSGDKNIRNSRYLTQRMWKYLFEDVDSASEEVVEFTEEVFGVNKELLNNYITVGKKQYMKKIKIKEEK